MLPTSVKIHARRWARTERNQILAASVQIVDRRGWDRASLSGCSEGCVLDMCVRGLFGGLLVWNVFFKGWSEGCFGGNGISWVVGRVFCLERVVPRAVFC